MTIEEMLGVAEIVERAAKRYNEQAARFREKSAAYDRLIAEMNADHERKLTEHRDAFGVRTSADAKIIDGMRAEVEDLRSRLNALGIQAAKQAGEALGMVEGEGLLVAARRVVKERDGLLTQVQDMRAEIEALTALIRNHQANQNTMRLYEAAMELCEGGMVPSEQIIKLRGSVNTLQRQLADTAERAAFGQLVVAPRDQLIENDELRNANTKLRAEVSALQERLRNDERKAYQDGEALRAEVADLRGIVDMVHASLGIKHGDHIGNAIAALKAQSPTRSHPVKVGEWVRNRDGGLAQVLEVHKDWYLVARGHGWTFPCDPPADHDTPAGKEAAASVIRDFRSGDTAFSPIEIKGALFDDTKITVRREPDQNHGSRIVISDANDMGEANIYLTESGARQMATALIGLCDVRKVPQ